MLYPSVKTTAAADQSKIQSRAVLSRVYRLLTGQLGPKRAQQSGPVKKYIAESGVVQSDSLLSYAVTSTSPV